MTRKTKSLFLDIGVCIVASALVAFAFHYFANHNGFAPGGVNGLAAMTGYLSGINMGYFVMLFSLPIYALVFFAVNKKTAIMLTIYTALSSLWLILMQEFGMPYYQTEYNLIFAALATGIVSGFGFSLMIRHFGASGGTYAISSIIRIRRPDANIAWVSFIMDASVVAIAFFVYGNILEPIICTLINLFVANKVVDYVLQGLKRAFKFEVITDQPEEAAAEFLRKFGHGVTELKIKGMYKGQQHSMLICVVKKRDIGDFMHIIKKYPYSFSYVSEIGEVFHSKPTKIE